MERRMLIRMSLGLGGKDFRAIIALADCDVVETKGMNEANEQLVSFPIPRLTGRPHGMPGTSRRVITIGWLGK
jgi:hypothetical protein